jgi:hypothetical protein
MNASLQALLRGIVDYAGLFPPARLPLREAIHNYAEYLTESEAWLLGRFICPAAKLPELEPFAQTLFSPPRLLPLSVLGTGGTTSAEFLANLGSDLENLSSFLQRQHGRASADVYEVKLPEDAVFDESGQALATLLQQSAAHIRQYHRDGMKLFFEVVTDQNEPAPLTRTIQVLQRFNTARGPAQPAWGFKLRCGGLAAAAFPSTQLVATAIVECLRQQVPFKATAGLHHPLRHFDNGVHTHMHGFINVFGGAALAAVHGWDAATLQEVLGDEDASHFRLEGERFAWRNYSAGSAEIASLRNGLLTSFGSCSFDEPRADLRALGWL